MDKKQKMCVNLCLIAFGCTMPWTAHAEDINETTEWFNTNKLLSIIPGADIGGSGAKGTQYKIDGAAAWSDYVNPIDITDNMVVSMRTLDNAGNVSDLRTVTVRIDKIKPSAAQIVASDALSNMQITFTVTPGSDADSGVKRCDFQIQAKGSAAVEAQWSEYTLERTISDEGKYTLYARTVDQAGNVSEASTVEVEIDKTPPSEPVIHSDSPAKERVNFEVAAGTDSGSGVDKTEFRVTNAEDRSVVRDWAVYAGGQTLTEEGRFNIEARTYDKAGNVSTVTTADVEIDRTAPSAPVIMPDKTLSNAQITFAITAGTDDGVGVERTEYRVLNKADGSVLQDWSVYDGEQTLTEESRYTLEARSVDKVGNVSTVTTVDVEIDKTPSAPIVIPDDNITPAGGKDQNQVEITVPDAADPADDVTYTVVESGAAMPETGGAWQPIPGDDKITVVDEGIWDVYIKVTDPAGNETVTGPITIIVDRTAPSAPVITPDKALSNAQVTFAITAGTDDGAGVERTEYRVLNKADGSVLQDWSVYDGEQTLTEEGRYTLEARSVDKVGNVSTVTTAEVEIDKTPSAPIVIPDDNITPAGGKDQNQVEITVPDAADPADDVSYTVVESGAVMPEIGSAWQPIPGDDKITVVDEGIWDVYIKVTDPAGNETVTGPITIIVDRTAPSAPVITPDKTLSNDQISYTITPGVDHGIGVNKTEYRVLLQGDGGVFADWSAYAREQTLTEEGRYTIEAKSTDRLENISAVAVSNVEIDKTAPEAIIIPGENITPEGGKDQDQVEITVPDAADPADEVTYTVVESGAAMPEAGGAWQPIPGDDKITVVDEGIWDAYIKVTDPAGNETITGPITITVDRTGPSVIFNGLIPDEWSKATRFSMSAEDSVSGTKHIAYWFSYDATKQYSAEAMITSTVDGSGKVISYSDNGVDIPDGEYDIFAQAEDMLGNLGAESTIHVKIDGADPTVVITPDTQNHEAAFQIALTAEDMLREGAITDAASGVEKIVYTLKGVEEEAENVSYTAPIEIALEGEYTLEATATDYAGNQSVLLQKSFVLDETAPVISAVKVTGGSRSNPAIVEIAASDQTTLEYSFDAGVTWQEENSKSYAHSAILPPGTLRVRDLLGHDASWSKEVRVFVLIDDGSAGSGDGTGSGEADNSKKDEEKAQETGSGNKAGGHDSESNALYLKDGFAANFDQLVKGYLAGYEDNTFRPEQNLTRAEAAALFNRVLTIDAAGKEPEKYQDTTGHWAEKDIMNIQGYAVLPVYEEGYFQPDQELTLGEMAIALDQVLQLEQYDAKSVHLSVTPEVKATQRLYNAGMLQSADDGIINTKGGLTRVETVVLFNKIFGLDDSALKRPAFRDVSMQDWYYGDVGKATLKVCTKCEKADNNGN